MANQQPDVKWVQLDDEADQFASDLGKVYDVMAVTAVALLRGDGDAELVEWARIRQNVGTHLYTEIINGPGCQELMASIHEILKAKNLPFDWLS